MPSNEKLKHELHYEHIFVEVVVGQLAVGNGLSESKAVAKGGLWGL